MKDTRQPGDTIARQEDGQSYPVTVSPVTGLVLSAARTATGTIAVSLPVKPSANVTVTAVVLDGGLTINSGGTLTFTPSNYSTPQTVTFQSSPGVGGLFRVLFRTSGADVPGYGSASATIQVS
jgi:hypothetical protein